MPVSFLANLIFDRARQLKDKGSFFYVPGFLIRLKHKPQKMFCKIFKTCCTVQGEGCFEHFEPNLNDGALQAALIEMPTRVDMHYELMREMWVYPNLSNELVSKITTFIRKLLVFPLGGWKIKIDRIPF